MAGLFGLVLAGLSEVMMIRICMHAILPLRELYDRVAQYLVTLYSSLVYYGFSSSSVWYG